MHDLMTLSKYPFLQDAKSYVKNEGATVEELLTDPIFEPARTIAIERLDNSLKNKDVGNRSISTESEQMMELFSYPVARMITVSMNDPYFQRRYALSEAVHMYKNLLKEPLTFILDISKEFQLDIKYTEDMKNPSLFFTHYLHFAPTRYKTWKMLNRTMDHGFVSITKKDLSRILQEVLRKKINIELDERVPNQRVIQIFSKDIQRLKNQAMSLQKKNEALPVGKLSIELLPPCYTQILASIQAGENVPHMGRFSLVAFLNSLKLSTNEILDLFSTAPDFEEDRTRYQIEHILGKTGATSYKAPSCEKMKTYGICPSDKIDDLCKKTYHPLNYYQWKWKKEKSKK